MRQTLEMRGNPSLGDECGDDDGAEKQGDDDDDDVRIASVGAMIIFASFVALFSIALRAWIIDPCASQARPTDPLRHPKWISLD